MKLVLTELPITKNNVVEVNVIEVFTAWDRIVYWPEVSAVDGEYTIISDVEIVSFYVKPNGNIEISYIA